jgi:hypothetical protein
MSDVPELRAYRASRMDPLAVLERALHPEVVAAISALIEQRAEDIAARALAQAQMTTAKPWLTVAEAGVMLGCSPVAVRKRYARGRLRGRHQGRRLYIETASIVDLGAYPARTAHRAAPATLTRPGARTPKE